MSRVTSYGNAIAVLSRRLAWLEESLADPWSHERAREGERSFVLAEMGALRLALSCLEAAWAEERSQREAREEAS
jgi:hypothetical protein